MEIKLKAIFTFAFLFIGTSLFSQTANMGNSTASRGETLFKENNAKDAVQVLEYEIINGQISDNTFNFLGLGYYQLGQYEKSLDAFKRGLKAQPQNSKLLSYNMGNTFYALKDYDSAISSYSEALKADPLFYGAQLNRANALLMAGQLTSAREDYIDFITKCPDDPQKERIELLIKALEEEIARREEEARLLAEQNKAQWEEYDGRLADGEKEKDLPDWEQVEDGVEQVNNDSEKPEWERINADSVHALADSSGKNKINEDEKVTYDSDFDWEKLDNDNGQPVLNDEELVEDQEDWLVFSDEELDEMKELERQSREEHEKWLENEKRKAHELATREAQAKQKEQQQALEDERRMREQLIEEMRKADEERRLAEEERRKKLLEDVANSLQGTDSTNLTSGAEDLIDYDLEGELD